VLYSFYGAGSDGRYPYSDLTFGPDGTMYGFTNDGGPDGNGVVFQFN